MNSHNHTPSSWELYKWFHTWFALRAGVLQQMECRTQTREVCAQVLKLCINISLYSYSSNRFSLHLKVNLGNWHFWNNTQAETHLSFKIHVSAFCSVVFQPSNGYKVIVSCPLWFECVACIYHKLCIQCCGPNFMELPFSWGQTGSLVVELLAPTQDFCCCYDFSRCFSWILIFNSLN